MAEELNIIEGTKAEQYEALLPQIKAIIEAETDVVANLANIAAMLKSQFNWWWVGFYLVKQDELVLGPFQGPLACTRIQKGKGVCGTSWQNAETIVVADVEQFPGHIACSAASQSEIVIPIIKNGEVLAVLDVDSEHLSHFDDIDKLHLEQLAQFISI